MKRYVYFHPAGARIAQALKDTETPDGLVSYILIEDDRVPPERIYVLNEQLPSLQIR